MLHKRHAVSALLGGGDPLAGVLRLVGVGGRGAAEAMQPAMAGSGRRTRDDRKNAIISEQSEGSDAVTPGERL